MRHSAKAAARQEKERVSAAKAARAGEAASGRGRRLAQLPYAIVLCGAIAALAWIRGGDADVRSGTLFLAGVLLAAAAARLVLPDRWVGMLGSRRRLADVASFAALAVGLLVAGLVFPVAA